LKILRYANHFVIFLRIDKESYSEKSDVLVEGVRRVSQLVAEKKSFDGENENKRPDVSRTKTRF